VHTRVQTPRLSFFLIDPRPFMRGGTFPMPGGRGIVQHGDRCPMPWRPCFASRLKGCPPQILPGCHRARVRRPPKAPPATSCAVAPDRGIGPSWNWSRLEGDTRLTTGKRKAIQGFCYHGHPFWPCSSPLPLPCSWATSNECAADLGISLPRVLRKRRDRYRPSAAAMLGQGIRCLGLTELTCQGSQANAA